LELGAYTLTNGSLTVVLSDAADGTVAADAIRRSRLFYKTGAP
jgi:hypothetical protein